MLELHFVLGVIPARPPLAHPKPRRNAPPPNTPPPRVLIPTKPTPGLIPALPVPRTMGFSPCPRTMGFSPCPRTMGFSPFPVPWASARSPYHGLQPVSPYRGLQPASPYRGLQPVSPPPRPSPCCNVPPQPSLHPSAISRWSLYLPHLRSTGTPCNPTPSVTHSLAPWVFCDVRFTAVTEAMETAAAFI